MSINMFYGTDLLDISLGTVLLMTMLRTQAPVGTPASSKRTVSRSLLALCTTRSHTNWCSAVTVCSISRCSASAGRNCRTLSLLLCVWPRHDPTRSLSRLCLAHRTCTGCTPVCRAKDTRREVFRCQLLPHYQLRRA